MLVMELLPNMNPDMRIEIVDNYGAERTSAPAKWLEPRFLEREVHEISFHEGKIVIDLKGADE